MNSEFSKDMMIAVSRCDSTGKLGVSDTFCIFMDIASEHAERLRIGIRDLGPENLFWLTVKTKIRFLRRPGITENVTVTTWPEKAEGLRCVRDYRMSSEEEVLIEGKTQWALINTKTGELVNMDGIYPPDMEFKAENADTGPFSRFGDDFPAESFAEYRVCSTDIDLGRHMNNGAYVRAIESIFTTGEWNRMDPECMEILFKSQCREGDVLKFSKKITDGVLQIRADVEGKPVVYAAITPRAQAAEEAGKHE